MLIMIMEVAKEELMSAAAAVANGPPAMEPNQNQVTEAAIPEGLADEGEEEAVLEDDREIGAVEGEGNN